MKTIRLTKILLTLTTVLALTGCKKDKCLQEIPEWCHTVDLNPDHYDPVCGCDGQTYQNSAIAECIGGVTAYTKGECK